MTKTNKLDPRHLKKFVIKKYVMAISVVDALQKEKKIEPDSIVIDKTWEDKHETIGFKL